MAPECPPTLVEQMKPTLPRETKLYADLPIYHASDYPLATVPMQYAITTARPDIVIKNGKVPLIELTIPIPFDESKKNLHRLERERENELPAGSSDLDAKGVQSSLTTLEIGALGHSSQVTNVGLTKLLPKAPKQFITHSLVDAGKVAVTCSQKIFYVRDVLEWHTSQMMTIF